MREVADQVGVGIGTVYRNFPTRANLVAAVFRRDVDACAAEVATPAEAYAPVGALSHWLHCYTRFIATKKGLAAALHSGDPAFAALPDDFREKFEPALEPLLNQAAELGDIQRDVTAYDLLRGIGNLSVASGEDGPTHTARMVDLLIKGLRHGARASSDRQLLSNG